MIKSWLWFEGQRQNTLKINVLLTVNSRSVSVNNCDRTLSRMIIILWPPLSCRHDNCPPELRGETKPRGVMDSSAGRVYHSRAIRSGPAIILAMIAHEVCVCGKSLNLSPSKNGKSQRPLSTCPSGSFWVVLLNSIWNGKFESFQTPKSKTLDSEPWIRPKLEVVSPF